VTVQIVTTNDFLTSFSPQRISCGEVPGAAVLQATVDDLGAEADRAGGPAWWLLYANNAAHTMDRAERPALADTAQARSSPGASAGSSGTPPDQTASGAGGG
jgi:hypothetical protein